MAGERFELPLGDVCDVKQGRYLGPGDMSQVKSEQTPIPVIGANGILGYTDRFSYREPVTLVTCRGSNCGMLQRTKGPTWISNNAMACPPKKPHDSRYIHYVLQTTDFGEVITGSAQPQITTGHLNTKVVTITRDPEEQKAIAAVLGALDDKIELNRRMNATLEATARALFQSWFIDFDPVRRNMDRNQPSTRPSGHPSPSGRRDGDDKPSLPLPVGEGWDEGLFELDLATAALFPDSFEESELGHIPRGWKVMTLSDLTSLITKGTTPTQDDIAGDTEAEAQINYVRVNSIDENGSILPDKLTTIPESVHTGALKRSILKADDVLYTIAGTIGRIALAEDWILPANTNQAVAIIRPEAVIPPGFLILTIQHEAFREELHQNIVHAVQANLSLGMLSKARIVVPPVSFLRKLFASIEDVLHKITANRTQSRTLSTLRDALLPKLLSGEIMTSTPEPTQSL